MLFFKLNEADGKLRRYGILFVSTIIFAFASYLASFFLFTLQTGLMSVFFTSCLLIPSVEFILEKNKNDVWHKRQTAVLANIDMICSLLVIFAAVILAFIVFVLYLPIETVEQIFFSQIHDTMTHTHLINTSYQSILSQRIFEFFVFFTISLIFRVGSIFILVWIASIWGVVYGVYVKQGFQFDLPSIKHYAIVVGLSGFLVFVIRTLSFITACMAGIFLSKSFVKYSFKSKEFQQVLGAVIAILAVSIALLVIAVLGEHQLYQ